MKLDTKMNFFVQFTHLKQNAYNSMMNMYYWLQQQHNSLLHETIFYIKQFDRLGQGNLNL